ncbi:hypothetical protein [Mycobacterium leprae]|nr:hypothetical protein [Mycobacterium leprae]
MMFRLNNQLDAPTELSLVGVLLTALHVAYQVDDVSTMRGEVT